MQIGEKTGIPAPAKTNLYLDVHGKRPDGYHEITTVFLPLPQVADVVTLEILPEPGLRLTCSRPDLPCDEHNLVWRAATTFAAAAGCTPAWAFHIDKRVPVAAGLGGGSSDAAAALKLLNRAAAAPLPPARLAALAVTLGADVPFFLQDAPAQATGIGERLEPVACRTRLPILLVNPLFPIPTPWAYRKLDETPRPPAPSAAAMLAALDSGDPAAVAAAAYNAFDFPVCRKYPLIRLLLDAMRRAGCLCAHVSGSGATLFGICPAPGDLPRAERVIRSEFDLPLWIAPATAGAG